MSDSSLKDPWLEFYLTDEENLPIYAVNKPKPNPLVAKVGGKPTATMERNWVSEVRNDVVNVDFSSLLNSLGHQEKYDEVRQSLDPAIVRVARKISARRVLED
ncbi:hypothetical protein FBU59_004341, partial [Linderina macrospora]